MNWLLYPQNTPPNGVPLWVTALVEGEASDRRFVGEAFYYPTTGFCDEFDHLSGRVVAFIVLPGPFDGGVA